MNALSSPLPPHHPQPTTTQVSAVFRLRVVVIGAGALPGNSGSSIFSVIPLPRSRHVVKLQLPPSTSQGDNTPLGPPMGMDVVVVVVVVVDDDFNILKFLWVTYGTSRVP